MELISLLAIGISALLASIAYLIKQHWDMKKNARKALYLLLEIRHITRLSCVEPGTLLNQIKAVILDKFGASLGDELPSFPPEMSEVMNRLISQLHDSFGHDFDKRVVSIYEDQLLALAADKPLLAFQLKGSSHIKNVQGVFESYFHDLALLSVEFDKESTAQEGARVFQISHEQTLNMLQQDLEDDILKLAKSCGFIVHYQTKKLLRKKHQTTSLAWVRQNIEVLFDKYIEAIAAHPDSESQPHPMNRK